MATKVRCTFWDPAAKGLKTAPVTIDATLGALMLAIRNACQDYARDNRSPGWAQPTGVEGDDQWFGFRMEGRNAHLVRAFPSKAAAEMWLVHYAQ